MDTWQVKITTKLFRPRGRWGFRLCAALLAALALTGPSCHMMRGPEFTGAVESADIIRVRLESAAVRAVVTPESVVTVRGSRGELVTFTNSRELVFTRRGNLWRINGRNERSSYLVIATRSTNRPLDLDGRTYRGRIILAPVPGDSEQFTVDNHLPLEQYLAGVLARELPASWRLETFKAQAIAARTYALYEMTHGGLHRSFDVYDDQSSQVYGGVEAETFRTIEAVNQTRGLVMACGPRGDEQLFKTFFSSTCGGRTNPVEVLTTMDPAPLPLSGGVVCTECGFSSKFRWPTVTVTKQEAYDALIQRYPKLEKLGGLTKVAVRNQTEWGRPMWLTLTGPGGGDSIRAEDLRLVLLRYGPEAAKKLYSATCEIVDTGETLEFRQGRGFGHGVGLCQYGAEGMARKGAQYYDILYHYYPGSRILQYEP